MDSTRDFPDAAPSASDQPRAHDPRVGIGARIPNQPMARWLGLHGARVSGVILLAAGFWMLAF